MSQQINLFNPIFLKQKKYFSAATMAQALGLLLLGSAILAGYARYQLSALAREADTTSARLASVQAQFNKIDGQQGTPQKSKELGQQLRQAEAELKSLQQIMAVTSNGDLGNTQGYSEYMRAFSRQIVNGVWLTGFSIHGTGQDIALYGRALKPDLVPAFITRLKREPALQGKSFAALDIQAPADKGAMAYIDFSLRSSGVLQEQQAGRNARVEFARSQMSAPERYLDAMRAAHAAGANEK